VKKKLLRFLIGFALSLLLALGIYALQASFRDTAAELDAILCDVTFAVGVIFLCAGLLVGMTNLGVFDMLAYGMVSFFNLFAKREPGKRLADYLEYREAKKAASLPWLFLALIGLLYIAAAFFFVLRC